MHKIDHPVIVELGSMRSFQHGGSEFCMVFDEKHWHPDKPELWDFSAGCFSRVFAEVLGVELHSVDINKKHTWVTEVMTKGFNVTAHTQDSREFLKGFKKQTDLLYQDCGDLHPLEPTAQLHLEEAKIIVEKEIVKLGGFILIDDTKNPVPIVQFGEKSRYGKAKYSIGHYLANGFEIIMNEYQTILKRLG